MLAIAQPLLGMNYRTLTQEEVALNKKLRQAVKYAALNGDDTKGIEQFLDQGGDVERVIAKDPDLTLLEYAVDYNQLAVCKLLVAAGANPNNTSSGKTPLMIAHNESITKLLIDAGADVNARDKYNATPLFHAENIQQMELLLAAKADINAQEDLGFTPLLDCIMKKDFEKSQFLISHGASLHTKTDTATTPLHFAATHLPELYAIIVEQQKKHCKGMITALLFFKNHPNKYLRFIYKEKLLKPHLESYTLKALLCARNNFGLCACDHLK